MDADPRRADGFMQDLRMSGLKRRLLNWRGSLSLRSAGPLRWWSPGRDRENFGDALSPVIAGALLNSRSTSLEQGAKPGARLLAVGSILHFARDGDVLWGTGLNGKISLDVYRFRSLDVRAVRGPLTREFLLRRGIAVPPVYGDPALLLPRLVRAAAAPNSRSISVMLNLHDAAAYPETPDAISPLLPWRTVLDRILNSRLVVSSSLHGAIVAEAFGIPARFLRLSEIESPLKYEDYLLGTGRPLLEFARSVSEAIEMGGMPPPNVDIDALRDSFPFDLWSYDVSGPPRPATLL